MSAKIYKGGGKKEKRRKEERGERARASGGRKGQKKKKRGEGIRRDRGEKGEGREKELLYGTMETCTYRHMCEYTHTHNVCAKMRGMLQVFRQ